MIAKTDGQSSAKFDLKAIFKDPAVILLVLSVAFTVLSSLDETNDLLHADSVRMLLWILLFALLIFQGFKVVLTKYSYAHLSLVLYCCIVMVFFAIGGNANFSMTIIRLILLPCFVYIVVINFFYKHDEEYVEPIVWTFVLTVIICSLIIITTYDISSWLNSSQYIYSLGTHKNSMGQLLGTALIFCILYFQPDRKLFNVVRYIAIAVIVLAMLYVQCRSALVAVILTFGIYLISKSNHKILYALLVIAALLVLSQSETFAEIFGHVFYLDKYSTGTGLDVDRFSSGRLGYYAEALEVIKDNLLFGTQTSYVDNFWLCMLENLGVVGCLICFPLIIFRFVKNIKSSSKIRLKDRSLGNFVWAITIFTIVISMFEAYPPFGPGSASMMFWTLSAVADVWEMKESYQIDYGKHSALSVNTNM